MIFFYTRKEVGKNPEGETVTKEFRDSLNTDKIVRSIQIDDERYLILLDDLHQRGQEVPDVQKGKIVGTKRVRDTFQSEIYLSKEDFKRFEDSQTINIVNS